MKASTRGRGVTLIELSTTLAAATAVVTLGIPAFQALQSDWQRNQVCSALTTSFARARSEAVRRGLDVRLCPSGDGFTCVKPPAGDWSAGWIVTATKAGTAQVIESMRPGQTPPFAISADAALAGGVTFSSAGLPSATGLLSYNGAETRTVFRLTPIGRLELVP